ncbi:MAG TPA: fatty acid desaturase, partial [Candidatus Obscuribacterales bacterium]
MTEKDDRPDWMDLTPAVIEQSTRPPLSDELAAFLGRAKPKVSMALFDLICMGWSRIFFWVAVFAIWPNPLTFFLAASYIASGMGILVALSHEAQHAALLPNKKWNDLVGAWLCAYPVGSIYGSSRAVHLAHHKYVGTDEDP